ncbi:unnamed protein product [Cochlearia groenlandica]
MKGVFGTLERLNKRFTISTPPIFERECREREGKLQRWLEDRPKFSYEASNFELPSDLEVDSLLEFSDPDCDAEGTHDGGEDIESVEGEKDGERAGTDEEGVERIGEGEATGQGKQ